MGKVKRYVQVGEKFDHKLGWSEVCMHLGRAGDVMSMELVSEYGVQLYENGRPYSYEITLGEAGVYRDGEDRFYIMVDE